MPGDFGSFIKKKREVAKASGGGNERVHVYCRLRPALSIDDDRSPRGDEADDDAGGSAIAIGNGVSPLETFDEASVQVRDLDGKLKQFKFDRFFDSRATQVHVFEAAAAPVIDSVVEGHNGTIFAYGQTGSGKTHTMLGPPPAEASSGTTSEDVTALPAEKDEGVIPRSLRRLFNSIGAQEDAFDFKITVSYIQIYCEILSDLLQPSNADSLVIRERSGRSNEVYVSGASRFGVGSADECLRHIQAGSLNRSTAFTQMNATSSRSHAVFILSMEKRPKDTVDAEAGTQKMVRSQLFLVDLAGSERVANTGVMVGTDRFRELRAINLSLSALGNCIHALSSNSNAKASSEQFVPYRDSKLTRLLQNSLGGNSKTSLIITVGPSSSNARETLSTLQFGTRAMAVKVTSVVNMEVDYKALYQKLLSEADKRDDRIHQLEISEREHRLGREAAEKSKERAEARAQKLELELKAQKASTQKLEAALKNNFVNDNADEDDDDHEPVFLTGEGIESPKRNNNQDDARMALAVEQKLRAEVEVMSAQFEEQVAKIRSRSQQRVEREQQRAAKAIADWHALELELAQTKEEMLATLERQREVQAELVDIERDSTERIADLTLKVQDLETELDDAREAKEGSGELADEQLEAIRERVEKRVLENYVSQDKVVEMKQLYEDVVGKLEGRIDKLEVDVTKVASPSKASSSAKTSSTRQSRYGASSSSHHSHSTRGARSTRSTRSTSRSTRGSGAGSKSSSHVSVVRSRAQARVRQSDVKRSNYTLSSTRGGRSTTGSSPAASVRGSYRGRATASSSSSKSTSRTRAKEYAEKQRAAKLLADAARIRNRRTSKTKSSSSRLASVGEASTKKGSSYRGGFGSSRGTSRLY